MNFRTPLEQRIGRHATEWAIEHLQLLDYTLVPPQAPGDFLHETLSHMADRHRVCHETLRRRLAHPDCPAFEAKRTEAKRIITLRSNYSLEAFLRTPSMFDKRYRTSNEH